jgi:hypothetical protein
MSWKKNVHSICFKQRVHSYNISRNRSYKLLNFKSIQIDLFLFSSKAEKIRPTFKLIMSLKKILLLIAYVFSYLFSLYHFQTRISYMNHKRFFTVIKTIYSLCNTVWNVNLTLKYNAMVSWKKTDNITLHQFNEKQIQCYPNDNFFFFL